jgi:hypothetical protein
MDSSYAGYRHSVLNLKLDKKLPSSTMSISLDRIYFKKCSNCGFKWTSRDSFLTDSTLQIIGYQASFKELTTGLLYFNHSCRGTLAIQAYLFGDLYDGPIFKERATGGKACPGYCLHREELQPCPAECECAYVREIVQIIKKWPKR